MARMEHSWTDPQMVPISFGRWSRGPSVSGPIEFGTHSGAGAFTLKFCLRCGVCACAACCLALIANRLKSFNRTDVPVPLTPVTRHRSHAAHFFAALEPVLISRPVRGPGPIRPCST